MKTTLSVLALILTFISCKKEETKGEDQTELISKGLYPFKFKTGSYWVYEKDSSATLDTVQVIGTDSNFCWSVPRIHGYPGVKSEYFKIGLKSSQPSGITNYYLNHDYIRVNGGVFFCSDGQPVFHLNLEGHNFNGMKVVDSFPSLTINGNIFSYVTKVKITASEQFKHVFDTTTYLYFTDSIGLIRKEIETSSGLETWSIKTWNIIR